MSFGVVAASYLAVANTLMQVVDIAQGTRGGSGAIVVTPPTGASGYLAIVSGALTDPPTPPSGWIAIDGGSGSWSTFQLYYANSLPGDTWSGTSDFCVQIVGYNRPLSVPVQYAASSMVNNATFDQPITCPSLSTTQPSLIARIHFAQPWADTGPYVPVYPANTPLNRAYIDAPQGGNDCVLNAVAHESQTVAGATGTADWKMNMGLRDDSSGITLVLGTLQ